MPQGPHLCSTGGEEKKGKKTTWSTFAYSTPATNGVSFETGKKEKGSTSESGQLRRPTLGPRRRKRRKKGKRYIAAIDETACAATSARPCQEKEKKEKNSSRADYARRKVESKKGGRKKKKRRPSGYLLSVRRRYQEREKACYQLALTASVRL